MAVLTITLLIANIALVGAAIVKINKLEQKRARDTEMVNETLADLINSVQFNADELYQGINATEQVVRDTTNSIEAEVLITQEIIEEQVKKSTENLFWRIITTPLKMTTTGGTDES